MTGTTYRDHPLALLPSSRTEQGKFIMTRHLPVLSARGALLVGTLAMAMTATQVLPAWTPEPGTVQASPRQGHSHDVGAERKKEGRKARTVTKTFSSDVAISIPDSRVVDTNGPANPYPSRVAVEGIRQGRVLDVNLTLRGFSHQFPADVAVLLVAPNGANAVVMADVGDPVGDELVSDLTITLDDEAAAPMSEESC